MAKHEKAGLGKGDKIMTDVGFLNRVKQGGAIVEAATRHRDEYLRALGVADIGLLSLGGEDGDDE